MTEMEKLKQIAEDATRLNEAKELAAAIELLIVTENISVVSAIKGLQMALCEVMGLAFASRPDASFERSLVTLLATIVSFTTKIRKKEMERRSKEA